MTTEATPGALGLGEGLGPLPEPDVSWVDGKDKWGYDDYSHAYSAEAMKAYAAQEVAAERDCRTCAHYAPHHYGEMLHCASPIRCVGASSYKLSGGVQLWEARPIEPAPF